MVKFHLNYYTGLQGMVIVQKIIIINVMEKRILYVLFKHLKDVNSVDILK